MAKATLSTEEKPSEVTLDEFCTRLSMKDKRVELIGGYHADEKRNGSVKDSEENFKKRFELFIKRPA